MSLSLTSAPVPMNSTNGTFDLSFWLNTKIIKSYSDCRHDYSLNYSGGTLILDSQENQDYMTERCHHARTMMKVFPYLSMAVGIPANAIALVALSTLKPRSIGLFYIALLAAADLAALVMRFVDFLMVKYAVDTHKYICGIRGTVVNFFPPYANWLLVLIVFERFYTLRFPLSKAAHFTFGRARLLAGGLALLLLSYNLSRIFLVGESVTGICSLRITSAKIVYEIDKVLLFYGPLVLIFIFVSLIAHGLCLAQKARMEMFKSNSFQQRTDAGEDDGETRPSIEDARPSRQGAHQPLNQHTLHILRKQRRNERSLTIMMFSAAIFFVVMTLPLVVVFHTKPEPEDMWGRAEMNFKVNSSIAQCLNMLTHVANFFLYFITCRRLRNHLWKMLRLDKIRRPSIAETEMTKTSRASECEMDA